MNKFSPFHHRGSLPCNVCLHEQVARVDAWLVQGISLREIERRTGLSRAALQRHRVRGHVNEAIRRAHDVRYSRTFDAALHDESWRAGDDDKVKVRVELTRTQPK
jgi:hypothetical protein